MSLTLAGALLAQVIGILLLRHRLGRTWLRRPVSLLFLAAVIGQGLSAVLLAFPSVGTWDIYRAGIKPSFAGEAALLTSSAMLALVIAYLLTQPRRTIPQATIFEIRTAIGVLDWRLLAAACIPLAVVTYEGRGYNGSVTLACVGTPLATQLAVSFFILLVIMAAFAIVLRYGRGWFLPVLIGQSIILAAAGERTPVISGAIALILLLARANLRPSSAQLHAAAALTIVAVLAIMGVRAQEGRSVFYADSGLSVRAAALVAGIASPGGNSSGQQGPGLVAQAADRLDGDSFTAAILQSEALGQPRLSVGCVPESVLLVVPSA